MGAYALIENMLAFEIDLSMRTMFAYANCVEDTVHDIYRALYPYG
jgi:hypothetical protein